MGFLTAAKPKITEKEIKELGNDLVNRHDFSQPASQFVTDVILKPHVEKSPYESVPSISKEEATKIKEMLRDKRSGVYQALKDKYVSDADIEELEAAIDKALITNR